MSTGETTNKLAARRRQAGFTLLEALVVMIVGIVISAAAFGIYKLYIQQHTRLHQQLTQRSRS
jgi:type II secretory pathway pseudopilin PulG